MNDDFKWRNYCDTPEFIKHRKEMQEKLQKIFVAFRKQQMNYLIIVPELKESKEARDK